MGLRGGRLALGNGCEASRQAGTLPSEQLEPRKRVSRRLSAGAGPGRRCRARAPASLPVGSWDGAERRSRTAGTAATLGPLTLRPPYFGPTSGRRRRPGRPDAAMTPLHQPGPGGRSPGGSPRPAPFLFVATPGTLARVRRQIPRQARAARGSRGVCARLLLPPSSRCAVLPLAAAGRCPPSPALGAAMVSGDGRAQRW